MRSQSQFSLLRERRFLPFFVTQFFGAFNDNVFKNALIILIAFQSMGHDATHSRYLVNISAALFILPFFLFSSTAGQIGDGYEKSTLIRSIKLGEIFVMLLAVVGFMLNSVGLLMAVLFLMGTQSSLFGPVKYGYLPQHLNGAELTGGNGLVEMGTFMAILFGMMLGSAMMAMDGGKYWVSTVVMIVAITGYISAKKIPYTPAVQPGLKINWNVLTQTWATVRMIHNNRTVLFSVLGISWFWFIGSTYMVQLPNYTREVLNGDESVYILLITVFCIGISAGSLFCEKLSGHQVELGLVPLGAAGISLFGVDLYFSVPTMMQTGTGPFAVKQFLQAEGGLHCLADIALIGIFGGLYIVPLFAVVQERSPKDILSRVIAANNILNAFFMVLAAVFGIVLLGKLAYTEDEVFLVITALNVMVTGTIFLLVPEFVQRLRERLGSFMRDLP